MHLLGFAAFLFPPTVVLVAKVEAFSSPPTGRAIEESGRRFAQPRTKRARSRILHSTNPDLDEDEYSSSAPPPLSSPLTDLSPFERHAREVFLTYANSISARDDDDGLCDAEDPKNCGILREDIRTMLLSLDIDATSEESLALFKYLDSDGDGCVSLSDFLPWYSEACSGAQDAARAFQEVINSRRTVHRFDETEVDEGSLRRALQSAINAPNRRGTEPWRFIQLGKETVGKVVELKKTMNSEGSLPRKIANHKLEDGDYEEDYDEDLSTANGSFVPDWSTVPHWCVVTYSRSPHDLNQQREDFKSVCCAVQNFMLSMWSEGIGTKWTDGPVQRTDAFAELCGIDFEKEKVAGVIWYGFARGGLKWGTQARTRKRGVDDVLTVLP